MNKKSDKENKSIAADAARDKRPIDRVTNLEAAAGHHREVLLEHGRLLELLSLEDQSLIFDHLSAVQPLGLPVPGLGGGLSVPTRSAARCAWAILPKAFGIFVRPGHSQLGI